MIKLSRMHPLKLSLLSSIHASHYLRLEGAISENGLLSFTLKRPLRNQKLRSLLLAKFGRIRVQLAFVLVRSA